MKVIPEGNRLVVELTRRDLEVLLAKLDDPLSMKWITSPGSVVDIIAVENEVHYSDREPGPVFMPSTGEYL